jgi:hypothetical protein
MAHSSSSLPRSIPVVCELWNNTLCSRNKQFKVSINMHYRYKYRLIRHFIYFRHTFFNILFPRLYLQFGNRLVWLRSGVLPAAAAPPTEAIPWEIVSWKTSIRFIYIFFLSVSVYICSLLWLRSGVLSLLAGAALRDCKLENIYALYYFYIR